MPKIKETPKKQIAASIWRAMCRQNMSQAELARRMRTSRAVVYRLLNENDGSLTLATLSRALTALGLSARLRFYKEAAS